MDYRRFVKLIPPAMQGPLSDRLVDLVLTTKNDEKMPSQLAKTLLHHWQQDTLRNESGLTVLLEAILLLEPERTITAFTELQMTNIADEIKEAQQS